MAAALLGFTLVLLAAAGGGMTLLAALRADSGSSAERFVMGAATGLGLLAYAILAVGLLGWLRPPVLLALILIEGALGAPALLAWLRRVTTEAHHGGTEDTERANKDRPDVQDERVQGIPLLLFLPVRMLRALRVSVVSSPSGLAAAALSLYCLYIVLCTLAGALAPPNGDDWDSLAYHLAAPKIYLAHGRVAFIPYDSHTDFPFTLEMLYTLGLAFGGPAGAKLFHWAAGWLTALAIAAFCRRLFPATASAPSGLAMPAWGPPLAAALFLSIPQVQWQATTAYIDLGATLFQFLALVAFVYAVTEPVEALGVGR